ncbi:MAG TPA: SgcJ/EcaC family oxidoreductase [Gemmatimonadota bacterium]|nr:SgcJ/EcaC family oxidoreductase [Gemmatimonadota bacterium]
MLVCAAGFALACETQEPATEQGSETSPATDEAAAREAIEAVDQAWEDAASAGNAAGIAALYTTDAIALPPGGSRTEGPAAIEELFGGWFSESGLTSIDLNSDMITVAASGDLATAIGSYTATGTAPDGTEWTETGKYAELLKNVDGTWKIYADIWNSDGPPAGMESESMTAEPEAAPAE